MELLAPAGGMSQLNAALRFGADAVYGGMKRFGLRSAADNFSPEELREALAVTHGAGKRFYLTLNILPYDEELEALISEARQAWEMGVDAAIVSDLGAFSLLRKQVPDLPLHVSTQANIGREGLCGYGRPADRPFPRAVPAADRRSAKAAAGGSSA